MQKLIIPVALALAATLAGCGKNDTAGSSTTAATSSSTTSSTTDTSTAPATTAATTPSTTTPGSGTTAPDLKGSGVSGTTIAANTGAATPDTSSAGAAAGGSGKGQQVFSQTCVACHGAGVAGAPKVGDKADWDPRIAQGKETLYQHAIAGFQGKKGVMPPKGGNTALADADVKSAVDYMVSQAK